MIHFLLIISLLASACSSPGVKDMRTSTDSTVVDSDKVLIVYLSRTNNTKAIAKIIQANVGGKMVAIELEKPYPENYQAIVKQVADENAKGFLPPLRTRVDSMEKYDVVFVGFPTWGMQLPPPMKSFLKEYDLANKTVVPFNTNGGYGIGSTFQTVKELCPDSKILEGFTMKGGSERDGLFLAIKDEKRKEAATEVKNWLRRINLMK